MTPEEKAKELLSIMAIEDELRGSFELGVVWSEPANKYAKECALKAVDVVFEFMKNDDEESNTVYWANHPTLTYWQNVKQELNKM